MRKFIAISLFVIAGTLIMIVLLAQSGSKAEPYGDVGFLIFVIMCFVTVVLSFQNVNK